MDGEDASASNPLEADATPQAVLGEPALGLEESNQDQTGINAQKISLHSRVQSKGTLGTDPLPPLPVATVDGTTVPTPPRTSEPQEVQEGPVPTQEAQDEQQDPTLLMDPNHPLMERVQLALTKQLTAHHERLSLELLERKEVERKTTQAREAVGVELYTHQQELAKLQAAQEGVEDQGAVIRAYREEAERSLQHAKARHAEQQQRLKEQRKNFEAHKQELDKISLTLKQVDLYNEELRSKILVAKRSTLKAEEDIVAQEMEKKRQDYFIDRLHTRFCALQEQRSMFEMQLVAQQKETKAAMETLQEAAFEMEAIQFEKRQLMQQWKSSMIGLQRRQELLFEVQEGISANKDTILSMDNEIGGFRLSIRKTQEEAEALTQILHKLEHEISMLKRQTANSDEQVERLKESYAMYNKSLQQTEADLTALLSERNALQLEYNSILKQTELTQRKTQGLEDAIEERLQAQLSMEKGVQGVRKDGSRVRATIYEKEALITATENTVSAQKLQILLAGERVKKLQERSQELDEEANKQKQLLDKCELDFKRKADELVKKQSETDSLNKKLDHLTANSQEQNMGPMEAIIYNLNKAVQERERECTDLSKFWLKSQNELIALSKAQNELSEEGQEQNLRLTVLERKRAVMDTAFQTEELEIKAHQRNIKQLQQDMQKINSLILKQSKFQGALEENNLELEQEFRAKLKTAELESLRLEEKIEQLKDEKERGLRGLVEAERQILLWEKKIQLAKETQAALDPNVGATEIKEMQSEIHRMKLRHATLLKHQEKLITEMERCVYRRESIATKSKNKGKSVGQAALQKMIAELTKKVKQSLSDISECDQDILTLQGAKENILLKTQDAQSSCHVLRLKEEELMQKLERLLQRRQVESYLTISYQRQQRRFQELAEGKYQSISASEEGASIEYSKAQERLRKIEVLTGEILCSGADITKPVQDSLLSLKKFLIEGVSMTAC